MHAVLLREASHNADFIRIPSMFQVLVASSPLNSVSCMRRTFVHQQRTREYEVICHGCYAPLY